MAFEHYIRSGTKQLRCGFTTGTCSALASQGALVLLLSGKAPDTVKVMTPKGIEVKVELTSAVLLANGSAARCSVIKDAGDDADVTDGIEVFSMVRLTGGTDITIDGGEGVGRVTKPGLNQPVGNAAINSAPREQIAKAVRDVCTLYDYHGGVEVVISIPRGAEKAEQTFNPMLGIEGGISVLGTSGIVSPMSEQALIDTIEVCMKQTRTESADMILAPGNYGETFIKENGLDRLGIPTVLCSNFLGNALDMAAAEHFEHVLFVSHIGKLVKVAAGIMNTHSKYADGRNEVFTARAAVLGADTEVCKALMAAATTDACIEILENAGLKDIVLADIMEAVQRHLEHRVAGAYAIGAMTFSNVYGMLGATKEAEEILKNWRKS